MQNVEAQYNIMIDSSTCTRLSGCGWSSCCWPSVNHVRSAGRSAFIFSRACAAYSWPLSANTETRTCSVTL